MKSANTTTAAYATVTTLFFAWGFITSLVDPLVAAVKGIFSLSDVEAQLSASAFFIAYGVMSFPAAAVLARLRAAATVIVALLTMLGGCLIMLAAANIAIYPLVLLGLFIMASGITMLQVAANPLAAILGAPERSHLRLTLAQAFNSVGTFFGPYLGAALFLRGVEVRDGQAITAAARADALGGIDRAFFWIAALIVLLIAFFAVMRRVVAAAADRRQDAALRGRALMQEALQSRWALLGGGAIFCYVGAEVAIGTQLALFLNDRDVLDVSLQDAAKLVSLYWGGAMVGRLIGSVVLGRVAAFHVLAGAAAGALMLCLFVAGWHGPVTGYAALSVGLMNAVMFPVIFTLTLERSTASRAATSGLLCFAIVGGAAIPPLTGLLSGAFGYAAAFVLPALCYVALLTFARLAARTLPLRAADPTMAGH